MSSFLEMLELARAKAMTSIEELKPPTERAATPHSMARVAQRDFRQRADADTIDNKARELLGDEAADAGWVVGPRRPLARRACNAPPRAQVEAKAGGGYGWMDPDGTVARSGYFNAGSMDQLLAAHAAHKPGRDPPIHMSSTDGNPPMYSGMSGGEIIQRHRRDRYARVSPDPARLYESVLATLQASRERVGATAFGLLREILSRVEVITRQGVEFDVRLARDTRGPASSDARRATHDARMFERRLPLWILRDNDRDKWRWLSSRRCLVGFDVTFLRKIYGFFFPSLLIHQQIKSQARRAFAPVDACCVPSKRYVGSMLKGATGVVIALQTDARGRDSRRLVKWTTTTNEEIELSVSKYCIFIEGYSDFDNHKDRRDTLCCDLCIARDRSCDGGCQDTSLIIESRTRRGAKRKQPP